MPNVPRGHASSKNDVEQALDCSAVRQKKLQVRCILAGLGLVERAVLEALRSWENHETGEAFPSQEMLAMQTDVSREKVNRAIKHLRGAGIVTAKPRNGTRALAYAIVETERDQDPNPVLAGMLQKRLAEQPSRMVTQDHNRDHGDPGSQPNVTQDHNHGDPGSPEVFREVPIGSTHSSCPAPAHAVSDGAQEVGICVTKGRVVEGKKARPVAPPAKVQAPPKKKGSNEPLPFAVQELADAFAAGAGPTRASFGFLNAMFTRRAKVVIRELADFSLTLDDVRLAGEYMLARPYETPANTSVCWDKLTTNGWLLQRIAAAKQWAAQGKPADRRTGPSKVTRASVDLPVENRGEDYDELSRKLYGGAS